MPKVLVAPGIGDIHWVMLKMEGLIKNQFEGETPEVWVWSENKRTERAEDYVRRLPFVKWGGYFRAEKHVGTGQQVFVHGKPWMMNDWQGFDLFIAFNAPLGWGTHISKLVPAWDINWNYEIRLTDEDLLYGARFKAEHGSFVLVSFFGHSFYKTWLEHFGLKQMRELLGRISERYCVVLTGREWDALFMGELGVRKAVNLTSKTSLGQLMGLCSGARAFVGFAAGNGMIAQHLNCPTFMLWHPRQWSPAFSINWVDAKRRERGIYHPLSIKGPCIDYIMEHLNEEPILHRDGSGAQRKPPDGGPANLCGGLGEGDRQATEARGGDPGGS